MRKINLETCAYPYYNLALSKTNLNKDYRELKSFPFKIIEKKNSLFIDLSNYKKIEKFLRLADYFSEEIRMKCHFDDNISPYDFFQKNRQTMLKRLSDEGEVCFTYDVIDNYLWQNINFKQCSNFPIPVALILLRHFNVKKWLDPSAGWGDRLVSAIAHGCEYNGVDPNLAMQSKYQEIINNYAKSKKDNYQVTPLPFENFEVPNEYYDLVFTSPPFFKLEKYSTDITQCNVSHPTLGRWLNNFLFPLIKKAEKTLTINGHLALYISDYREFKYVEKCKNYVKEKTKLKYHGTVNWKQGRGTRYIYIWKKTE